MTRAEKLKAYAIPLQELAKISPIEIHRTQHTWITLAGARNGYELANCSVKALHPWIDRKFLEIVFMIWL